MRAGSELRFYGSAILAGLLGAAGDVLIAHWTRRSHGPVFVVAAFLSWNLGFLVFALALRTSLLARAVIVFLVVNAIVAVLASRFMFGETLTMLKWSGVVVALLGMVLIELG